MSRGTNQSRWLEYQRELDEAYASELNTLDPKRVGLQIICPQCKATSWIKFPERRYTELVLWIACPKACGAFDEIKRFSPVSTVSPAPNHFDISYRCIRDGVEVAVNGVVFRCPGCGIENLREVMRSATKELSTLPEDATAEECAGRLGMLVGTFDGVMRACNQIALSNASRVGKVHPSVRSFQNIKAARTKLMPVWDMGTIPEWQKFVLIIQKRHLFAHGLGVADSKYLAESRDLDAEVGRKISLRKDEIVFFGEQATKLVDNYFGHFLS